jgi:hypothetical protein
MSIPVDVSKLAVELDRYGASAFVLTVRDDSTPHVAQVTLSVEGGTLRCPASRTAARNVVDRPSMSILWPPFEEGGYSMIVDGECAVDGDDLVITPTNGVLHRPAPAPEGSEADCGSDCAPLGADVA